MEVLQELLGGLPRTVLVLICLAVAGVLLRWSFQSHRYASVEENEAIFKARPVLLVIFVALCCFGLWHVIFGVGESSPLSHGLEVFLLLGVLPRVLFLGIAVFFGIGIFLLRRSYIRVNLDAVEYFDGWHKPRCIARNDIVSADVRYPGAVLFVQCADKANNFSIPLLAYSRAGLLAALLQRKI